MKEHFPNTRAVIFLKEQGVSFERYLAPYHGPGDVARKIAADLGAPEPMVFKTLVFQSEGHPLIAIMDAAHRVSLSKLTDAVGARRRVEECSIPDAERYTGYIVGGISPFGTRRPMPVYLEAQAMTFERIYINGGSRGFILLLSPQNLVRALNATVADLAV